MKYKEDNKAYLKKWREETYYDGQREKALERDGYKCVQCGILNKKLSVHHIDWNGKRAKKYKGGVNNALSNLMTVCEGCHRTLHAKYGRADYLVLVARYWDKPDRVIGRLIGVSHPTIKVIRKQILAKSRNGARLNSIDSRSDVYIRDNEVI